MPGTTTELFCDTSSDKPRPIITYPFRRQIVMSLHNLSHPGAKASAKLVSESFVCPDSYVLTLPRSKIGRLIKTPLAEFPLPPGLLIHVHIDLIDLLPVSFGFRYCLTAVDRFTSSPEAFPIPEITVETVAKSLVAGWICRFGCPQQITTNQGRQFTSQLFQTLSRICGKHIS